MDVHEHIEQLQRDGARLADVTSSTDPAARVPTCPEWQLRDLVRHVGGVHRWATGFVVGAGAQPPDGDLEQLVGGFGMAGATVFLMQRCRRAFSASHFAMATSVVSLASTFSGYASGPLNERLGHPLFFTVAFLASLPSLVLVLLVPKTAIELDPTDVR